MAEGETLPKSGKSKDWIAHADKKLKELRKYHSERNILGRQKRNIPVGGDDYSRILSQNELSARSKGMKLKREETAREKSGMAKGGTVRATGKRKLHKGEMVSRKSSRTSYRGGR